MTRDAWHKLQLKIGKPYEVMPSGNVAKPWSVGLWDGGTFHVRSCNRERRVADELAGQWNEEMLERLTASLTQ